MISGYVRREGTKLRAKGLNWAEIARAVGLDYWTLRRGLDPEFHAATNAKARDGMRRHRAKQDEERR